MQLLDRHEFRLSIPGLVELKEMVRTFVEESLRFAEFDASTIEQLTPAVCALVRLVEADVESAGDLELPITVHAVVDSVSIEFAIHEHGRPEGGGLDSRFDANLANQVGPGQPFDRAWWVHRGTDGSELHLQRARPHAEITTLAQVRHRLEAEALEQAEHNSAPAGTSYRFRPFQDRDALEVSRCIYEAYGYTYPNPDLFYPERIVKLNRDGRLRSLIAETTEGAVVGHYALERPDLGPIGEAGQAVIHHEHRGRGLMQLMRRAVEEDGRKLGLLGIWSQPTARHPFSQKMNLAFGSVPCGLSLGTTPASTTLRGSDVGALSSARQSCFLYWHPFNKEEPLRASVPAALVPLLKALYQARGRPVQFDMELRPPSPDGAANDAVRAGYDRARGVGHISVDRIGTDTLPVLREAARLLEEVAGAEVLFVDLPIDDASCAYLADQLSHEGFIAAGIGPRFHSRPDGAEDTLRLQKLIASIDVKDLVAEGELGRMLADFVLTQAGLKK